jgi:hypothetical protein
MAGEDNDQRDGAEVDPFFEEFASPLGHVLLEFNYLEVDAGRMIARLLRQDDVTAGVFAGLLSFMYKLKLIQALAAFKVADPALKDEFEQIVKEATEVNARRNRYVHAEYMPLVGPGDELVKMLYRRLKDSAKTARSDTDVQKLLQPVDAADLAKLAKNIHGLAYRMRVLSEKFVDQYP